jgi:hypothetical protein
LGAVKVIPVEGMKVVRDFSFVRLVGVEAAGVVGAFQRFAMGAVGNWGDK